MRRFRWSLGAVALVMAAMPVQAVAGGPHGGDLPDTVALPDGWQPEGITTDGRSLYVGSLADGAIWRADIRSGKGRVLAEGADGRVSVGVDYDRRRDLVWAAGGATGEVRAHDADTGRLLRTYFFPSEVERFVNDLVVTRRAVYATDSVHQELLVVPLRKHHRWDGGRHHGHHKLPLARAARLLPLHGDLEYQEGFNLNGIALSGRALVAVQSNTGQLFRINGRTGHTDEIEVAGGPLTFGDGLEPHRDLLYVVRNQENLIAVVDLDRRRLNGEVVAELTDPELDVPTTVALAKGSLWAVNARFNTPPTPETIYSVTRLDDFDR